MMTENTEYVTVNEKGVLVGGTPVTYYNGTKMIGIGNAQKDFANIKKVYPYVEELHIGLFESRGQYAQLGNPSGKGLNSWCRAKFCDGSVGKWVALYGSPVPEICYSVFVSCCCNVLASERIFQSAVLKQYKATKVIETSNSGLPVEQKVR